MKIKVAIIILGLIIATISGVKINSLNKEKKELEVSNMVLSEENIVKEENITSENRQENNELDTNKKTEQIAKSKEEKVTKPLEQTPKTSSTQTKSITENKKEKVIKNTQESAREQQKVTNADEIQKKEETQTTKPLTPSDLKYWCVEGGSHHVAGDGNNEHGYYKSWDEAHQAFLNYTKDWSSVQYKISQCPCGLYYFWATK